VLRLRMYVKQIIIVHINEHCPRVICTQSPWLLTVSVACALPAVFFHFSSCCHDIVHCCVGGTSLCSATVVRSICPPSPSPLPTPSPPLLHLLLYQLLLLILQFLISIFAAMYSQINALFSQVSDDVAQIL